MEFTVVSVDPVGKTIQINRPLWEDFTDDLGGGVYGYVTKARHIHTAIFIGGVDGVVAAVNQPPRIYTPPAFDDFLSMYRYTFDMNVGYHTWEPQNIEVWFGAASNRPGVGPAIRA